MIRKNFKKILITAALAYTFCLLPTATQAASLTLPELMSPVEESLADAQSLLGAMSSTTSLTIQERENLSRASSALRGAYTPAYSQALIDIDTHTKSQEKYKTAVDDAKKLRDGTTFADKRDKNLAITTAYLRKTEVEIYLIQTNRSLLKLEEAQLVLAKIDLILATQNEGGSNAVTSFVSNATTQGSKSVIEAKISLALGDLTKTKSDLENVSRAAQESASSARTSALIADAMATNDLAEKEEALKVQETVLRNKNISIPNNICLQNLAVDTFVRYCIAKNIYDLASIKKNGPDGTTPALNLAIAYYTRITETEKIANDAALARVKYIFDNEDAALVASAISSATNASVSGIAGIQSQFPTQSIWASDDEEGGESGSFNPGAFLAQATAPCAAVAVASQVLPRAMGAIAMGASVAASALSIPVTAPLLAQSAESANSMQTYNKGFMDCMIYTMGQLMIENITNDIVIWIQGGFNGKPRFATDLNSLLDGAEDIAGGDLVRQLRGLAVCDFSINFIDDLGLENSSRKKYRNMFTDRVSCPFGNGPLLEYTASQFQEDFTKGGWRAYEAHLRDSGNPYGVKVLASRELMDRKQTVEERNKDRLSWSGGFADVVDTTDCTYPSDIQQKLEANVTNPEDPNYIEPQTKKYYQRQYCKTSTPGNIVQSQLQKTTELDLDRLGVADSLNKIIHTLITTLSRNAVKSAFKKL